MLTTNLRAGIAAWLNDSQRNRAGVERNRSARGEARRALILSYCYKNGHGHYDSHRGE